MMVVIIMIMKMIMIMIMIIVMIMIMTIVMIEAGWGGAPCSLDSQRAWHNECSFQRVFIQFPLSMGVYLHKPAWRRPRFRLFWRRLVAPFEWIGQLLRWALSLPTCFQLVVHMTFVDRINLSASSACIFVDVCIYYVDRTLAPEPAAFAADGNPFMVEPYLVVSVAC